VLKANGHKFKGRLEKVNGKSNVK